MSYLMCNFLKIMFTSFLIVLFLGICFLQFFQNIFKSKVRESTPKNHVAKNNTPTAGGLIILLAVIASCVLWISFDQILCTFLLSSCSFACIGLWDDARKITKQRGIATRDKFALQFLCGCLSMLSILYLFPTNIDNKFLYSALAFWQLIWGIFLFVGVSNAVNLTDGLDGLALNSLIPNIALYSFLAYYLQNGIRFSFFFFTLNTEKSIFLIGGAILGALLGFLYFNAYPAKIFMGDIGSLFLGASLAWMAIIVHQELLLAFSGIIFVFEVFSVVLQIFSYRYCTKRFFRLAPFHHHLELSGWHEKKITKLFSSISILMSLIVVLFMTFICSKFSF